MPDILNISNDILKFINPYLDKKYFLWAMGSIFLLGIVAQWITGAVYRRLIKKAENMVSPKNKMLKQIKMKFENCKAVNGVVANPSLMVERYINKYRFMGITLNGLSQITNICAMLCLALSGVTGFVMYELNYGRVTVISYVLVGVFLAFALDIYAGSVKLNVKEGELICIITDFLENTLNCKERRQERTAEVIKSMESSERDSKIETEQEEEGTNSKIVSFNKTKDDEKFGKEPENDFDPIMIPQELKEEKIFREKSDLESLREQEYIINEVLGEFL